MTATLEAGGTLGIEDLRGNPRRLRKEAIVHNVVRAAALVSIAVSAGIIYSLATETWTFVSQVERSALFADGWFPRAGEYGMVTLFAGTIIVTLVGLVVAVPVGLGAAIYLSEYAPARVRRCSNRCSRSSPAFPAS